VVRGKLDLYSGQQKIIGMMRGRSAELLDLRFKM